MIGCCNVAQAVKPLSLYASTAHFLIRLFVDVVKTPSCSSSRLLSLGCQCPAAGVTEAIDHDHEQHHGHQHGAGFWHVEQAQVERQHLAQAPGAHDTQHGGRTDVVFPSVQGVTDRWRRFACQFSGGLVGNGRYFKYLLGV